MLIILRPCVDPKDRISFVHESYEINNSLRQPSTTMWIRSKIKASRGDVVPLSVDGKKINGYPGEMLAVSLRSAGIRSFRDSPVSGMPRGPFCLMGVCQECLVVVDGHRALSCREFVRKDMKVNTLDAGLNNKPCKSEEKLR